MEKFLCNPFIIPIILDFVDKMSHGNKIHNHLTKDTPYYQIKIVTLSVSTYKSHIDFGSF